MESAAYDEMRALEDHHWWFRGKRRMVRPHLRSALSAPGVAPGSATCPWYRSRA